MQSGSTSLHASLPMNLRPEAAPTYPRQPLSAAVPDAAPTFPRPCGSPSLPYLLHPCSRLPLGEGGPKGQVRERPPVHGYNSWQRRGQAVSPCSSLENIHWILRSEEHT